ncbi:MAG: M28 family peptidase [Halioglobus sp.]
MKTHFTIKSILNVSIWSLLACSMQSIAATTGPVDEDSKTWWSLVSDLSSDDMEGRDTGSPGHERAARLVAQRLAAAGLQPLGENGGWFQRIPFEEIAVSDATLRGSGGDLVFLDHFTVRPNTGLPSKLTAPIAYRGYCAPDVLGDVTGKLVICHGTRRSGLTSRAERKAAVREAGAAGIATIADPGFSVEPPRWPYAYARTVKRHGELPETDTFVDITLNAATLHLLLGRDTEDLVALGSAGQTLPLFDSGTAELSFVTRTARYSSPNVIGLLPGTNPSFSDQAIVIGAHLDGYGFGRAVNGDVIYNGTLDDAAYVALIVHLMEKRAGQGYERPIIVAIWTGEEKGLHGSRWFIDHPTVSLEKIAANINLDQLRPIFPLEVMTVHALSDTTLGTDASVVAEAQNIRVQEDPEPERNLLRRTDHWPFLNAGIPAINFVFGFEPGSRSEEIYRQWYRTGYHKPQDDIAQLMDWQAATDFNNFFYALVNRVANQKAVPAWREGSKLRPPLDHQ